MKILSVLCHEFLRRIRSEPELARAQTAQEDVEEVEIGIEPSIPLWRRKIVGHWSPQIATIRVLLRMSGRVFVSNSMLSELPEFFKTRPTSSRPCDRFANSKASASTLEEEEEMLIEEEVRRRRCCRN